MRRRRHLITGPVLIGFAELFDAAHGDPETPRPYVTVAPASVGRVLLPFPCPRCGKACCDAVDPKRRGGYRDAERDFSWCPACGFRYHLDVAGVPLASVLPAGASSAPAKVTAKVTGEVKTSIGWRLRRRLVAVGRALPVSDGLALLGVD